MCRGQGDGGWAPSKQYNVVTTLRQRCDNVATTLRQRCDNVVTMLFSGCDNVVNLHCDNVKM